MTRSPSSAIIAGDLRDLRVASTDFAIMKSLASVLEHSTVLNFPDAPGDTPPAAVIGLRREGFTVSEIAPPLVRAAKSPHGLAASVPFRVYEGLKRRDAGTLHVVGDLTAAHYLAQAKRLGILETPPAIVAHVTAPLLYRYEIGRERPATYADQARVFMERRVVEQADIVIAYSRTICSWMLRRGWQVDPRIAPGLPVNPGPARRRSARPAKLSALLFAGSLTDVKGLTSFIYIAERLERQGISIGELVFSGAEDPAFPAKDFVVDAAQGLSASIHWIPAEDRTLFLERARKPGTLSVIPSRFDDMPVALQELIAIDAPVVASDVGDLRRVLHPDDAEVILAPPHHIDLCEKIKERAKAGLVTAYKSLRAPDLAINARKLRALSTIDIGRVAKPALSIPNRPLVSVCLAHFNRTESVFATLDSINAQTYDNYELVIVDDGSAQHHVTPLEEYVSKHPNARLIRQENRYLGAARNTGARNAKGDYVLFKDDDNIAKAHEIETFVDIAERNQSDILTCFSDNFEGDGLPNEKTLNGIRRLPFGPDPLYGLFRNGFGDSNCFVRRTVWEDLGGFTEHYKIGLDDHEFFMRATMRGYQIELVPESLYFYRLGGKKMKRFHVAKNANEQRIMTPILDAGRLPAELLPAVMMARDANA